MNICCNLPFLPYTPTIIEFPGRGMEIGQGSRVLCSAGLPRYDSRIALV